MAGPDWQGRCHCGAIGFVYHCTANPARWAVRACQCRFCRCHDALSTSNETASIAFQAATPEALQRYRFGLNTADFLLCKRCGVYIGAVIKTDAGHVGIINTHALDPQPRQLAAAVPISYDGEDTDDRVQRRQQHWSPVSGMPR